MQVPQRAGEGAAERSSDELCRGGDRHQLEVVLARCERGEAINIRVQDVQGICVRLQQLLQSELDCMGCHCPICDGNRVCTAGAEHEVGKGAGEGTGRLDGLLKLAAAWLSWCIHNSRFVYVSQFCVFMSRVQRKRKGCAAEKRIHRFLTGVQALCMQLHGVKLDVS